MNWAPLRILNQLKAYLSVRVCNTQVIQKIFYKIVRYHKHFKRIDSIPSTHVLLWPYYVFYYSMASWNVPNFLQFTHNGLPLWLVNTIDKFDVKLIWNTHENNGLQVFVSVQRYKENKNKIEDCISEYELIEELSVSHLIIYFKYMCITSYYITLNVLLVAKCRQFHRNYLSSIYG